MRKLVILALVAGASLAHAQGNSKKELVARLLQLQQASIEALARNIVERPAVQMMQSAGAAMQAQVPPSKRDAVAKSVDADIRKFVDEASPLLAERAVKLALIDPSVVQKRIHLPSAMFPETGAAGELFFSRRFIENDPYLFRGETKGVLTRLSASTLCNVQAGAGTVPTFVLEDS